MQHPSPTLAWPVLRPARRRDLRLSPCLARGVARSAVLACALLCALALHAEGETPCVDGTTAGATSTRHPDTLFVRQRQVPILVERQDNVLMELRLHASSTQRLDELTLTLGADTPLEAIQAIRLYYSGTDGREPSPDDVDALQGRWSPVDYVSAFRAGHTLAADSAYSSLCMEVRPTTHLLTLRADQPLATGVNFFWVSIQMQPDADLDTRLSACLAAAQADGRELVVRSVTPTVVRRLAIGLRHAGDDRVAAYRHLGGIRNEEDYLITSTGARRLGKRIPLTPEEVEAERIR